MLKPFYDIAPYSEFPNLKQPFDGNVRVLPIYRGFFLHGIKRDGKYYFRYSKNSDVIEANEFGESLWKWFRAKDCEIEEISVILDHKILDDYEILTDCVQALRKDRPLQWDSYYFNVYFLMGSGKGLPVYRSNALEPKGYWELDELYSSFSEASAQFDGVFVSTVAANGFWKHYRREFWWLREITVTNFNRHQGVVDSVTADGDLFRLILPKNKNWTLEHFKNKSIDRIVNQKLVIAYQKPSKHPYYRDGDEYEILTVSNSRLATTEELEHTRLKRGLRNFEAELKKGILIYEGN